VLLNTRRGPSFGVVAIGSISLCQKGNSHNDVFKEQFVCTKMLLEGFPSLEEAQAGKMLYPPSCSRGIMSWWLIEAG